MNNAVVGGPKSVLIAGAPTGCWTNTGDEAILAAMSQDLRSLDPDLRIQVVSSNPPGVLERYDIHPIPYNDISRLVAAARSSSLIILGGGSIFYDYWRFDPDVILTPKHEGLSFYGGIALLATILNKPLMLYAVGVGPLRSEAGQLLTLAAFQQANVVTVRDADSKSLMVSFGLDPDRVTVTADPVFNLRPEQLARVREIINEETKGSDLSRPLLGVVLRNWDVGIDEDKWHNAVAGALDRFIEDYGGAVLFLPFHKTVDWPLTDDLGLARRVRDLMQQKDSSIVFRWDYSPEEKSGILGQCDLVLGMRLHSLILSHTNRVPTVAVTFDDPKVQSALTAVGLDEYGINISDLSADRLFDLLKRSFENRDQIRASLSTRLLLLKDLAIRNAQKAAEAMTSSSHPRAELSPITRSFLKPLYDNPWRYDDELGRALVELRHSIEGTADKSAGQGELAFSIEAAERSASFSSEHHVPNVEVAGSNSRPRVALLTNRLLDWTTREPRFGGAERYCVALGELLTGLGFEVTFFQVADAPFVGEYYGFKVIALPPGDHFSEFQNGVCDSFFEATLDYDHVIYHMPNYASGKVREDALMICHDVWFDHQSFSPQIVFRTPEWFKHLYRAFSQPRKIVCVDTNSINVIRALWPELASRMTYVPNWVDTTWFQPPRSRNGDKPTVLFPRRSEIVRGAKILGDILDGVPHDCRFRWWLGEGTDEATEMVKAVARRDSRLEFYSVPSYEQMNSVYQQADICVIPSIASEATSLACLEALASGCAVVATNIGGLPNLIQPEVNGLLVDPEPGKIAAAINHLVEEPLERARLQRAARKTAEGFRMEIWQQRWMGLLGELGWIEPRKVFHSQQPAPSPYPVRSNFDALVSEPYQNTNPTLASPRQYDVISFSIIDWEFRWQRPQQIMSRFAEQGHRVFYLSISRFLPLEGRPFEVHPVRDNVWEVRLSVPQPIDVYSGEMSEVVRLAVSESLRQLQGEFNITRAVSVVQMPTWAPAAQMARDEFGWDVVYDCMDNWSSFPGLETKDALLRIERDLAHDADLLVVSSQSLWDKWSSSNSNSVLARNASDFRHFHDAAPNSLLADMSRPIVGYFGAIAEWFDLELMIRLANERPGYNFVLVGDIFDESMEQLKTLPNVLLPGHQPYELMPAYLYNFDACIIPFEVNDATDSMDVVKFYEFISQGKPVVAPAMKEILPYRDYLYIADDHDDFIKKVDLAIQEDEPAMRERRIGLARQNTWDVRLRLIKRGVRRAQRKSVMTNLLKELAGDLLHDNTDATGQSRRSKLLERTSMRLAARLAEREQAVQAITTRLLARERELSRLSSEGTAAAEAIQSLRTQLTERELTTHTLSAEAADREATIASLSSELVNQLDRVADIAAQLEQKDAAILARDVEIDRLSSELSKSKDETQRITDLLNTELDNNDRRANSPGGRLLNRYGRIKYRYLLPVYRALGLGPEKRTTKEDLNSVSPADSESDDQNSPRT